MWISEITVNNFRPFYGEQTVTFNNDSQDKFTIIEAKSDTGKTTFLSAISWCLYGKDLGDYNEGNIHPFNLERKDELDDGEYDEICVKITLNDDGNSNPKYIIDRKARCIKNGNNIEFDEDINLKITEWEGNEATPFDDPIFSQKIINSILPEAVHMFFLFEGEKLEKIFSFYERDNIQAAIEKVSQIQLVKSALIHLENSRDKIYKDNSKGQGDKDIQKNDRIIENLKTEIEVLDRKKMIYKSDLDQANSRIKEIDEILSKVNVPLINEWVEKRGELETKNEELEGELDSIKKEATESLLKNAPLAICSNTLKNFLDEIETTSQKDELPPKIKNVYVRELINKKMCICGRSLDSEENEDAKMASEVLNTLLNKNDLSDLAEKLIEARYAVKDIIEVIPKNIIKQREIKLKKAKEVFNEINKNLSIIEDLNEKLKETNEEKIAELSNERSSLNSSKDPHVRNITTLDGEIQSKKDLIVRYRREYDFIAKKLDNYNTMKKISDFMDRAYAHLNNINDEMLEEVRGKVQKKTFDSFINLHWDKDNYKKFEIDETYSMSLKDSNDNERIYNIASGTKQVLLLSFIAALAEVSGFKFPIFIDTPLANTDNSQRENIAQNLPTYLKRNQVILLVKDQEYTQKFRSIILNNISKELRFIKLGGRTKVEPWN